MSIFSYEQVSHVYLAVPLDSTGENYIIWRWWFMFWWWFIFWWWWFVIVVLGIRAFFIPIVGCGHFFVDFSF